MLCSVTQHRHQTKAFFCLCICSGLCLNPGLVLIRRAVINLCRIGNYLSFEAFSPQGSVCLIYVSGTSFTSCRSGMYLFGAKEERKHSKFQAFKQCERFFLLLCNVLLKCGNLARQTWDAKKCRIPYFLLPGKTMFYFF